MSEGQRINIARLKAAIISATSAGKGMTRRGLSMKASGGKNPDLVRDLISRGQDKKLSLETVAGIAAALELPMSNFVTDPVADSNKVWVIGAVEAGAWRETYEWPVEQRYEIEVFPSPVPGAIRRGLRLVGQSMNKIIPADSNIEYFPVIENGMKPAPGDLVIAQRRMGDLFETTCKRLTVNADGDFVLIPESYSPEHQEPIVLGKPDDEHFADQDVEIIGIVIQSYQSHFRRGA